jgi:hypothetical protein
MPPHLLLCRSRALFYPCFPIKVLYVFHFKMRSYDSKSFGVKVSVYAFRLLATKGIGRVRNILQSTGRLFLC